MIARDVDREQVLSGRLTRELCALAMMPEEENGAIASLRPWARAIVPTGTVVKS
jgi:hypothetical protein